MSMAALLAAAQQQGSGGGGGGFSPTDISGLIVWLDADQITGLSNGDTLTSWPDQSGNSNDPTVNGTGLTYRTSAVNGLPAVEGTSSLSDYLSFGNVMSGKTAGQGFVVCKNDLTTNEDSVWEWGTNNYSFYTFSNNNIYENFGANTRRQTGVPSITITNWHLYSVASSSGLWTSWLNGAQESTSASNTVAWDSAPRLLGSGAGSYQGRVAEFILYDSYLSTSDREAVEDYVADKYAITF